MFKFMKSKKGFSLVELMIVVVIMAILVAVAVPIFNSVTGNARQKTCIDNQRQVMTSIGNLYMGEGVSGSVTGTGNSKTYQTYTIKFNGESIQVIGDLHTFEGCDDGDEKVTEDEIKGTFKTVPGCGDDANYILATVKANDQGTATVSTACHKADDTVNTDHELEQNS